MRRSVVLFALFTVGCSHTERFVDAHKTVTPTAPETVVAARAKVSSCIVIDSEKLDGSDVDLEGRLFDWILRLDAPICVEGLEGVREVQEVQLAFQHDWTPKRRRAHVTGRSFPEHTASHVRPIVVSVETLEYR